MGADFPSGMSLRGWIPLMRAASAAGLAAFAAVIVNAPQGSDLEAFFNLWVYIGLMVFACVVVGSRAQLVARERAAWAAFTIALISWTFGEVWYAIFQPESYPSVADLGFLAFYPFVYIGIVALLRVRVRTFGGTLWLD